MEIIFAIRNMVNMNSKNNFNLRTALTSSESELFDYMRKKGRKFDAEVSKVLYKS